MLVNAKYVNTPWEISHGVLLCRNGDVIHYGMDISDRNSTATVECQSSYGTILLDHLAADGACLTGGQVTIVTVSQIHADFPWCPFYILNSPDKGVPTGF